jgi:hypothetical protein
MSSGRYRQGFSAEATGRFAKLDSQHERRFVPVRARACLIGQTGVLDIANLMEHTNMESLYLDSCGFDATKVFDAFRIFCAVLRSKETLLTLNLSNNALGDAVGTVLAAALLVNCSITNLNLSGNLARTHTNTHAHTHTCAHRN